MSWVRVSPNLGPHAMLGWGKDGQAPRMGNRLPLTSGRYYTLSLSLTICQIGIMSFDLPRLHMVLLREVGCGGWTGWLTARAKHLEAQGGPPTGTSVASLMDEVWIPPPHDKGDSQTTPPPRLTGHLVMSSGHSWGSSEEGSSHTLHEPRKWSVLALCPWLSPLLPNWTTRRAIVPLSTRTPKGDVDKGK